MHTPRPPLSAAMVHLDSECVSAVAAPSLARTRVHADDKGFLLWNPANRRAVPASLGGNRPAGSDGGVDTAGSRAWHPLKCCSGRKTSPKPSCKLAYSAQPAVHLGVVSANMLAMTKPKWLARDSFVMPVHYTLCITKEMWYAEMKRCGVQNVCTFTKNEHSSATTNMFTLDNGNKCAIVCLPIELAKKHEPIQVAALLVHEASHIWDWAMELVGEDEPSSEFKAYGLQTISQSLMYEYARQLEKHNATA